MTPEERVAGHPRPSSSTRGERLVAARWRGNHGDAEDGPAPAQGGLVHQRPEDLSGDYEYDLAHDQTGGSGDAQEERRSERPEPSPAGRRVELDQDLSYDEAHDF
jgi:hypothetical protein